MAKSTRIGPTSDDWRLLGIDLTKLLRSGDAREPMLMYLFERLDQLVDGRRLVWAVEEFHAALGDPTRRAQVDDALRTWRKRNALAILVSQNPTDASCAISFVEILLARLALSLVILVGQSFIALAASPLGINPDEVLPDPVLEACARALSAELRCMVCQNQSIDDSNADLAKDLRLLVRERITNGESDEQVLNYIVSRYGEFVLLKPRLSVQTLRGLPPLLRSLARRNEVNRQLLFGECPQFHRRHDDPLPLAVRADECRTIENQLRTPGQ